MAHEIGSSVNMAHQRSIWLIISGHYGSSAVNVTHHQRSIWLIISGQYGSSSVVNMAHHQRSLWLISGQCDSSIRIIGQCDSSMVNRTHEIGSSMIISMTLQQRFLINISPAHGPVALYAFVWRLYRVSQKKRIPKCHKLHTSTS